MSQSTAWHPAFLIRPGETIPIEFEGWTVTGGQTTITSYSQRHCPDGFHVFLSVEKAERHLLCYNLRVITGEEEIASLYEKTDVCVLDTDNDAHFPGQNGDHHSMLVVVEPV